MSYEDIMFINRKFILWVLMFGGVVDTIKSTNRLVKIHSSLNPTYFQNRIDRADGWADAFKTPGYVRGQRSE